MAIRYEELVRHPRMVLDRIFDFLALTGIDTSALYKSVKGQDGQRWRSNSSHESYDHVSDASIGRYKDLLTEQRINLIDACCYPEFKALGYHSDLEPESLADIISTFSDDYAQERPELKEFTWSAARCCEELERLALLREKIYQPSYFMFENAFNTLVNAQVNYFKCAP
jgi:hypothetical protein